MGKLGKLTVGFGRRPEASEYDVADIFLALGYDVELLPESKTVGVKSADMIMNGVIWEIKSPTGNNRRTVQRAIGRAVKQSQNVIFDSRHSSLTEETFVKQLTQEIKRHPDIKRLWLIGKSGDVLDIKAKI